MTIINRTIRLKKEEKNIIETMELEYDTEIFVIKDLSGQADHKNFGGINLYESFIRLNDLLNSKGFLAIM